MAWVCIIPDDIRGSYVSFTAEMEGKLDKIEEGNKKWVEVLSEFYKDFLNAYILAEKHIDQINIPDEISEEKCEKCRNFLVKKYVNKKPKIKCSH